MEKIKIKQVDWQDKLDDIKMIRFLVFQQEQGIDAALEFDGYDRNCDHLLVYLESQAVGTARIRYLTSTSVKIERLAVLYQARKQGIGTKLMRKALEIIEAKKTYQEIIIHAQVYLQSMYEKLGFDPVGDRFEEAGIVHIKMVRPKK
ncbi:MAG: GNAT family N-acetyltransferase [Cyanobacteria bacterium P01_G01_bin.49]